MFFLPSCSCLQPGYLQEQTGLQSSLRLVSRSKLNLGCKCYEKRCQNWEQLRQPLQVFKYLHIYLSLWNLNWPFTTHPQVNSLIAGHLNLDWEGRGKQLNWKPAGIVAGTKRQVIFESILRGSGEELQNGWSFWKREKRQFLGNYMGIIICNVKYIWCI